MARNHAALTMTAYSRAFVRASAGIDWSRPCLIWLCDYVLDETGVDPAAAWRRAEWTERTAMATMARVGRGHQGDSLVEKALEEAAATCGWAAADVPDGACVGVFQYGDIGLPAVFDGNGSWLVATAAGAVVTKRTPKKIWRLPCAVDVPGGANSPVLDGPGSG